MHISAKGIALIEQFEGLRMKAYQDGAGIWTIGYGHTGLNGPAACVKQGDVCTSAEADEWLDRDMAEAERAVNTLVKVPLTQNQFDALVSFTYNLGWAAFESSALLRLLNAGATNIAAAEFVKWDRIGGQVSQGMLHRRAAEQALYLGVA